MGWTTNTADIFVNEHKPAAIEERNWDMNNRPLRKVIFLKWVKAVRGKSTILYIE